MSTEEKIYLHLMGIYPFVILVEFVLLHPELDYLVIPFLIAYMLMGIPSIDVIDSDIEARFSTEEEKRRWRILVFLFACGWIYYYKYGRRKRPEHRVFEGEAAPGPAEAASGKNSH